MSFNWHNLLKPTRFSNYDTEKESEREIAFDSDYKRIVTSPAFRRLQDKTQVFPLERNDFVHTRLTHSIEVATIAREIAKACAREFKKDKSHAAKSEFIHNENNICRILESASLLHDIGNPPFGHFGEDIIRSWFKTELKSLLKKRRCDLDITKYLSDFEQFDGNAQALRIITKLHDFSGDYGMDLTFPTINTIIKYTRSSAQPKDKQLVNKKIGYFFAEKSDFEKITQATGVGTARYPLTFILEAADDITYLTADIEDALKKGLFTFDFFKTKLCEYAEEYHAKDDYLFDVIKNNEEDNVNKYFLDIRLKLIACAKYAFTKNYTSIISGTYNDDLFTDTFGKNLHNALAQFAIKYIFVNKDILKLEISGYTILTFLLERFVSAVIPYSDLNNESELEKLDRKLIQLISTSHKHVYAQYSKNQSEDDKLYLRLLMVTDFISGMTDSYAQDLYLTLSGNNI